MECELSICRVLGTNSDIVRFSIASLCINRVTGRAKDSTVKIILCFNILCLNKSRIINVFVLLFLVGVVIVLEVLFGLGHRVW